MLGTVSAVNAVEYTRMHGLSCLGTGSGSLGNITGVEVD